MNLTNRLVFGGIVFGSLASACTAIVLGKTSETSDYGTSSTSSSSSSSGDVDQCSLLYDSYGTADANACSDCINTSCKDPVAVFCPDGKPATYLSTLQNCAQSPWNGRSPPSSGGSFYGCGSFDASIEVPNDPGSEAAKEAVAHNCITNNCLQGDAPPCRLCEVTTKKPGSGSEYAYLKDDACGSCVATACAAVLSTCCSTQPVNDFVEHCSYTALSANKAACMELANTTPDAGNDGYYGYSPTDKACLSQLQGCFSTCKSQCQAVTTGQ